MGDDEKRGEEKKKGGEGIHYVYYVPILYIMYAFAVLDRCILI